MHSGLFSSEAIVHGKLLIKASASFTCTRNVMPMMLEDGMLTKLQSSCFIPILVNGSCVVRHPCIQNLLRTSLQKACGRYIFLLCFTSDTLSTSAYTLLCLSSLLVDECTHPLVRFFIYKIIPEYQNWEVLLYNC